MDENRRDLTWPVALAGLTALFHIATASDGYGLFRDELYYLACGRHPGFGYVDQPALIGWIAWFVRNVLGESMLAIRLLPALAAGATVFLASWIARELGGSRFAQAIAGLASALAPVYVGNFGFLSMNAFDVLFWTAAVWLVVRVLRTGEMRWWIPFGIVAGIGLENKISVLFLGFGLVVGLLVDRRFEHLRSSRFWAAGGIAFALFAPYLIWQVIHGWPTLEFMSNATRHKNLPLAPFEFLSAQTLMMNPLAVPLALAGLGFYLFARQGRPFRAIGIAFVTVVVVLITQRSKAYYLAPAYTMLLAAGAVALGNLAGRRGFGWVRPAAIVLLVGSGAMLAPLAKPILPVDTYVAYAQRLGVAPTTSERKELGRLPQFFADRLGWPELAASVAGVYGSLPAEDRQRACIYGQNYGQAGAIDLYGKEHGLPPAISAHNSYHIWGYGDCTGELVLVIGDNRESLLESYEQVDLGTVHTCEDCMPYENDQPIWICRNLQLPPSQIWAQIGHYD